MELITERGQIDTYDGFTWSLNYVTAEVVDLTGRKSSYSKTIQVPWTKANRAIYGGLDELNVDNIGYNTKESLRCFISHNGRTLMAGHVIVTNFFKIKEEQVIELQVVSSIKNLITKLKSVNLRDLDFSRWNHPYNATNIITSMKFGVTFLDSIQHQFGQGKGYIYPLIDFGKDDAGGEIRWNVTDLRPCLYLKELVDTVFRAAGLTYTSDFFESPYFRSIVLENTVSLIKFTDDQLSEFDAQIDSNGFGTYPDQNKWPDIAGSSWPAPPNQLNSDWITPLEFDVEVNDPLNQWDITGSTNVFTAQRNGQYNFNLLMEFDHEFYTDPHSSIITFAYSFTPVGNTITYNTNSVIEDRSIQVFKNGILFDEIVYQALPPAQIVLTRHPDNVLYNVEWQTAQPTQVKNEEFILDLLEGDTITFKTLDTNRLASPTAALTFMIHRFNFHSIELRVELVDTSIVEGDDINFSNYVPNIKADEFIDGVFNHFNIWVDDDKLDENNLIAEPRTNIFDSQGHIDMSDKLDRSRKIQSDFLADKLPKRFKYQYRVSDDVLNAEHNEINDLPYADFDSEVEIDFTTRDQIIPSIFSPLITQRKNGLYYPEEFSLDGIVKSGIGAFMKIGFISQGIGDWEIIDKLAVVTAVDEYALISEFDSVQRPTYSLTFGDAVPKFNQVGKAYWTVWRLFHEPTEREQTRDGALVFAGYFNLNENDIADLNLRRAWFIDGVFFRLVVISNVNPETNTSTLVKLLQVENTKFDFTSNEMIYKMAGPVKVLSTNNNRVINTQRGYVQPSTN